MTDATTIELTLEDATLDSLIEDPANARKHSDRNVQAIADSLSRFGQRRPIVVHRDLILAGNGTYRAAKLLGWSSLVVTRVPEAWEEAEARAFAIADNRTSDLATWDYEGLVASLGTIGDEELIRASGYTPAEYDDLMARLQEGAVGPGGVRTTPSLEEYGSRYADKATRLLVCEFPNASYVWLMDRLRDLRADLDVTNNADVILRLVADRFGEEAAS